jgi:hypothetical protein
MEAARLLPTGELPADVNGLDVEVWVIRKLRNSRGV